nr:MAG: replication initiator protein [Microvirus sp.]
MCLNPVKIAEVGFVACRECWQCRETKVDDWVGRCIAESKTATAAHSVTLTYGRDQSTGDVDNIRAAVLTYSDVQKYLKYLRADGFPVRYFAVGEYGSAKGRAHWHIILYWQGEVPDHVLEENFMQKHWTHGWSYWRECHSQSVRYACKYLVKDVADEDAQSWGPLMSKKPPLGHDYFRWLADKYVEQGLSPQTLFYTFPDAQRVPAGAKAKGRKMLLEKSKPVQFRMAGKTAANFVGYFIERWREVYGDDPPRSKLVLDYDAKLYDEWRASKDQFIERRGRGAIPVAPPFEGAKIHFSDHLNCYYVRKGYRMLFYSFDSEGDAVWHETIRPDAKRTTERKPLKRVLQPGNPRTKKDASKASSSDYRQRSKGE